MNIPESRDASDAALALELGRHRGAVPRRMSLVLLSVSSAEALAVIQAQLRANQAMVQLPAGVVAVVLPDADAVAAQRTAGALVSALDGATMPAGVGWSPARAGVASGITPEDDVEALVAQARWALVQATTADTSVVLHPVRDPHAVSGGISFGPYPHELRAALASGQVVGHVQPQHELSTGRVCGAEVLARWRHPENEVLLPATFVPLAAQLGLLPSLTLAVLDQAAELAARVWQVGHRFAVSVNVSPADLHDDQVPQAVVDAVCRHQVPAGGLRVELTEEALITDPQRVLAVVNEWRQQGISLSLDDYGAGYSAVSYLRLLPVTELKLDRVFADDINRSATQTIVRHTTAMAHELGLHVVAEGIVDADRAAAMAAAGCDVGQGDHYGAAMHPEDFLRSLL